MKYITKDQLDLTEKDLSFRKRAADFVNSIY